MKYVYRFATTAVVAVMLCAVGSSAYAQTLLKAELTPEQENHEVTSGASGTAALVLKNDELEFAISVDGLSGPITAAHFHRAPLGENGSPVRTITAEFTGNSASGIWRDTDSEPLTVDLIDALLAGELYINVHAAANPSGEIRGQVTLAAATVLRADLTTAQAGPAVSSGASGTATLFLTENDAVFDITVSDLSGPITVAHVHEGPIGVGGGPVRTLTADFSGNSAFGVWRPDDSESLTPERVAQLLTGGLYINVHTAAFGGGELRGQILSKSGWAFGARLDAAQETHTVTSDARGTLTATLTNRGIAFRITAEGLSGPITAAHFHNAAAGVDGGPVRTLTADFAGNTATGLWSFGDDQALTGFHIGELIQGRLYVNLHTAANTSGEIRGQLEMMSGAALSAALTPAQEVHDVTSDAAGTAVALLTDSGLEFQVSVDGLSGPVTVAHFHNAAAGTNGGPVRTITGDFAGSTASGIWTASDGESLTGELVAELLKGNLYLNVHTAANPSGEARGQLHVSGGTGLSANLTAAQESHAVTSDASGTASMILTPQGLVFSVTTEGLSGPPANAHFHSGAAGTDGPPVRGIIGDFVGSTANGLWPTSVWAPTDPDPLSDELITDLLLGRLYVNVHTAANAAGEIRGQVFSSGEIGRVAQLDADQETHDVTSDARGTAAVAVTPSGAVFNLTVEGLSGPIANAHIHNGPKGENGPPVRTILADFTGNTAAGVWKPSDSEPLTDDLVLALANDELYINIHTAAYGAGEIRGQLGEPAIEVGVERIGGPDEIPNRFELGANYPNPFNPSTTITFDLDAAGHVTLEIFDVLGRRLTTLVDDGMAAGRYRVDFDASELPSGTYVSVLSSAGRRQARSMVLLR